MGRITAIRGLLFCAALAGSEAAAQVASASGDVCVLLQDLARVPADAQ